MVFGAFLLIFFGILVGFRGLKMAFGGGIGAKNRRNFAVLAEISLSFGGDIATIWPRYLCRVTEISR